MKFQKDKPQGKIVSFKKVDQGEMPY